MMNKSQIRVSQGRNDKNSFKKIPVSASIVIRIIMHHQLVLVTSHASNNLTKMGQPQLFSYPADT